MLYTGVSDCNMEEARCAATPTSASACVRRKIRDQGRSQKRQQLRFIRAALEYEIERQIEIVESGNRVVQETASITQRRPHLLHAFQGAGARLPLFP